MTRNGYNVRGLWSIQIVIIRLYNSRHPDDYDFAYQRY